MSKLGLGLGLDYCGGYAGSSSLSPLSQSISIGRGEIGEKKSVLTSISNYATYIDTSLAYTTNSTPSWLNIFNGPAFEDINSFLVNSPIVSLVQVTKSSTKYVASSVIQEYYDPDTDSYIDAELGPWEFRWNGTAWELYGKADRNQSTASILKTYTGGSSTLLPLIADQIGDYIHTYIKPTTTSISAPNATGKYNQIIFYANAGRNIYKSRSTSILLSQTGKSGINYSVTQSGLTAGSPSVSLSLGGAYHTFFELLFTSSQYLNQNIFLPSSSYSTIDYNISSNADLTGLAVNNVSISPSSITIPDSANTAPVTIINADLSANTSSSSRTFTLTGTNLYNNGAVNTSTTTKQAGTAQPSPLVSISSNDTTPRNFYLYHTGSTLYNSITGEGEGIALWNSTQKVWRIAKIGSTGVGDYAIRYYGGKYEFIKIESGIIKTSANYYYLDSTASCSATLMPWKASWGGIINMSYSMADAMEKITELRSNTGVVFPLSGARSTYFSLFSSATMYSNNGTLARDFKLGQYSKVFFKGTGGSYYEPNRIDLKYDYTLNKWIVRVAESGTDGDGNSYGESAIYVQRTPSATLSFPVVFDLDTYSENYVGWTPSSTITISKQTAGALTDRYSLSDITETTTIPVDSAFSSIW